MSVLLDLPPQAPVIEPGVTLRSLSEEVSDRVLQPRAPRWWWIGFGVGATLLLVFIVQLAYLFINGVGIWGVNIPIAWGFAILEYVLVDRSGERRHDRFGPVSSDPRAVALGDQSHRRVRCCCRPPLAPACCRSCILAVKVC